MAGRREAEEGEVERRRQQKQRQKESQVQREESAQEGAALRRVCWWRGTTGRGANW